MSSDEIHQYYSARAPEYDRVYSKPERQTDLRAIEKWLPSLFAGHSIIEVACGTGYWTQFLAPVASEVVAIDASPETLEIAKERVPANTVQFQVGDAYKLPSRPEKFSCAFAGFWLSHVPRQSIENFLHGLHATLQPGARVVFLDNRYVEGNSTPISAPDNSGNTYQLRRLQDGSTHSILKNFPSESELRLAVAKSSSQVKFHSWQYYWALEYVLSQ
jgi:ubiquinone/menaquinone biosynthesis C-methylase UbiE